MTGQDVMALADRLEVSDNSILRLGKDRKTSIGLTLAERDLIVAALRRQPPNDAVRAALESMEQACERLAATRSTKIYEAMIDGGQTEALIDLDNARRAAQAALSPAGEERAEPVAWRVDGSRNGKPQVWFYHKPEWPQMHAEHGDTVTPLFSAPQSVGVDASMEAIARIIDPGAFEHPGEDNIFYHQLKDREWEALAKADAIRSLSAKESRDGGWHPTREANG